MYSFAEISDAGAIQDGTQTIITVESAAIMSCVSSQLQTDEKLLPEHFLVTIGKKKTLLHFVWFLSCFAASQTVAAVQPWTLWP